MIKALISDLDGTLFDSSPANVEAYRMAFKQADVPFDAARYQELFGLRFPEMMDALAPDTSDEVRAKIRELKVDFYQLNLHLVRPNEGLLALLRSSRPHYKTALVTTASKANVMNLLAHFQIESDLFDVVIVGEDVTNGKPDPECYVKAASLLEIPANECCVFEDSDVGIMAAARAGTHVIQVAL